MASASGFDRVEVRWRASSPATAEPPFRLPFQPSFVVARFLALLSFLLTTLEPNPTLFAVAVELLVFRLSNGAI